MVRDGADAPTHHEGLRAPHRQRPHSEEPRSGVSKDGNESELFFCARTGQSQSARTCEDRFARPGAWCPGSGLPIGGAAAPPRAHGNIVQENSSCERNLQQALRVLMACRASPRLNRPDGPDSLPGQGRYFFISPPTATRLSASRHRQQDTRGSAKLSWVKTTGTGSTITAALIRASCGGLGAASHCEVAHELCRNSSQGQVASVRLAATAVSARRIEPRPGRSLTQAPSSSETGYPKREIARRATHPSADHSCTT